MTDEKKTPRCDECKYCQTRYVAKIMDNTFKCRLMKYKTIDVVVLGGGSPAWCPLKKLTDGNPIVEGGFMRDCCICGKPFADRGYNPAPIKNDGVCCKECNDKLVIPRRMRDITIARIQRDADALATTAAGHHASEKLNALVGKTVNVKFWDGSGDRGVLHIDTLATRLHSADAAHTDNTRVIGYYLYRGEQHGYLHFKKSHITKIEIAYFAPIMPAIYLCNGENTHCSKTNCIYSGGGCKYTTNIEYAADFTKRIPIISVEIGDKTIWYDDEKGFVGHTETEA